MANHPNRTRINRERARAREYRIWQAEVDRLTEALNDPARANFRDYHAWRLAKAIGRRDEFASV